MVAEILEHGGKAVSFGCSVSDPQAVEAMMKQIISEQKRLDILVNNAGIARDNLILKMTLCCQRTGEEICRFSNPFTSSRSSTYSAVTLEI